MSNVNHVFDGQYCFNVYNQDTTNNWNHVYKRSFNVNGKTVEVSGMTFSGNCANNSFNNSVLNTYNNPSFGSGLGYGGTDLWKF
mmetsp:Transcript_95623/g.132733  ORF Transcript_95623/g.132733 Transcript_95623/m.132733 type:complete len:84 (-) Transcript_95623:21-272(-)